MAKLSYYKFVNPGSVRDKNIESITIDAKKYGLRKGQGGSSDDLSNAVNEGQRKVVFGINQLGLVSNSVLDQTKELNASVSTLNKSIGSLDKTISNEIKTERKKKKKLEEAIKRQTTLRRGAASERASENRGGTTTGENTTDKKKKKKKGLGVGGLLGGIAGFLMPVIKPLLTLGVVEWLSKKENAEKAAKFFKFLGRVAKFFAKIIDFGVVQTLEGLAKIFDSDAGLISKIKGFFQLGIGFFTLLGTWALLTGKVGILIKGLKLAVATIKALPAAMGLAAKAAVMIRNFAAATGKWASKNPLKALAVTGVTAVGVSAAIGAMTPEEEELLANSEDSVLAGQDPPELPTQENKTEPNQKSQPAKGSFFNFSGGGLVPGTGLGDIVPAKLTPGEFVFSKPAVDNIGLGNLSKMNALGGGTNRPTLRGGYSGGGLVTKPKEFAKGGIAKGPDSGYPAILHGTEAVIPLENRFTKAGGDIFEKIKGFFGFGKKGEDEKSIPENQTLRGSIGTQSVSIGVVSPKSKWNPNMGDTSLRGLLGTLITGIKYQAELFAEVMDVELADPAAAPATSDDSDSGTGSTSSSGGGAGPGSAKADMTIGDSIARGLAGNGATNGTATDDQMVGRKSTETLELLKGKLDENPDALKGKTIRLSSGILNQNNKEGLNAVEEQLKLLQKAGAKVQLVGAPTNNDDFKGVNDKLKSLAQKYGAFFLGGYEATAGDKVHTDYAKLNEQYSGTISDPASTNAKKQLTQAVIDNLANMTLEQLQEYMDPTMSANKAFGSNRQRMAVARHAPTDPDERALYMARASLKAIWRRNKGKTPELARGGSFNNVINGSGVINGPMSGYPVYMNGGTTPSFIGHGTEYVASKANGGFVIPINTPATKSNGGLFGRRVAEASAKGYKHPFKGYSGGGAFLAQSKLNDGTSGNRKQIFLHWSAGGRNDTSTYKGNGYHTYITASGIQRKYKYGSKYPAHTYNENHAGAAAIGVAGNNKASESNRKNWGQNQVTMGQYENMAKEAAAIAHNWGWKVQDINDKSVRTHWEEFRDNKAAYLRNPGGAVRWDLKRLLPQDAASSGPAKIRNMIKKHLASFQGVEISEQDLEAAKASGGSTESGVQPTSSESSAAGGSQPAAKQAETPESIFAALADAVNKYKNAIGGGSGGTPAETSATKLSLSGAEVDMKSKLLDKNMFSPDNNAKIINFNDAKDLPPLMNMQDNPIATGGTNYGDMWHNYEGHINFAFGIGDDKELNQIK